MLRSTLSKHLSLFRYFTSLPVPSMGDSISEGTVSAIHKNIGDKVKVDEIVSSLETDKVTVDIRTPVQGYITKFNAKIGDNVAIGFPLFDVEDNKPTSIPSSTSSYTPPKSAPAPSKPAAVAEKPKSVASPVSTSSSNKSHRIPSIQFKYGKREKPASQGATRVATSSANYVHPSIDLLRLLRRPQFSIEEIEAINSGGASLFDPKVKIDKNDKSKTLKK